MACCCKSGRSDKASTICLGRCELPKHRCLEKEDVKPGPVPKHMGWLYTAKDAPDFQLRCGWRPGHISCPVLRRIEQHNCCKYGDCGSCNSPCPKSSCSRPCLPRSPCTPKPCFTRACSPRPSCNPRPCSRTCLKPSCISPRCLTACPSALSCCKSPGGGPLLRIIRHAGQYQICTKPSDLCNSPSSPYPLKYVLNADSDSPTDAKYSVEAKFNDYHFDYTSSASSFIVDFSPPNGCYKPCSKRCSTCDKEC